MFKKRKAYEISDNFSKSKKKVKQDLTTPLPKQSESLGTDIENADTMEKWVERRLRIKAENKINNRRYMRGKMWKDLAWILLADIIITIGFDYFVSSTGNNGLIPFGFSGLARFFGILSFPKNETMASTFYFVYLLCESIPLIIFGFIKIDARFTWLTIFSLVMQIVLDQIITHIPYVTPEYLTPIINNAIQGKIPGAWGQTVWLFVQAVFGGVLLGVGFAMPYIVNGSNGGEDFISVYIERRYQKNIAGVNLIAYSALFTIVIILNTVITKNSAFPADIKYREMLNSTDSTFWHNVNQWLNGPDASKYISAVYDKNGALVPDGTDMLWMFQQASGHWDAINQLANGHNAVIAIDGGTLTITPRVYDEFLGQLSQSSFEAFPKGMVNEIRYLYLFGPSLFASIVMIILTVVVMNAVYPAHTIRTFLISTNYVPEMKQALINLGYRNAFVDWDANTQIMYNNTDRQVLMVTMSVSNWNALEKDLELVDPKMTVNILKTKKVKGQFDYEIRSDRELRLAWEILKQDTDWLTEIHNQAVEVTHDEHLKFVAELAKIQKKYDFKNIPDIKECKTQEQLAYWRKANFARVRQSEKRAILKLKNDWMSEWSESWAQYDYIKNEHHKAMKTFKKPNKTKLRELKKSYEVALKRITKDTGVRFHK